MSYHVNEKGYYGEFGGAYIPEMLYPNVEELRQQYLKITAEPEFQKEFNQLLKDYVGRPTPLYFAKRLSEKYNTKIYFKREDLCHTGAHKVNNTIGQILLAKRLGKIQMILWAGVLVDNEQAIRFYKKNNFQIFPDKYIAEDGYECYDGSLYFV